ncbi:tetratricopeptide repeat protein [Nonomuraea angiospora]
MTTPSAEHPNPLRDVWMDSAARDQGRVYQAARDQTINQITQQNPRRPLPQAATVQVPAGLAGLPRRPAATFVGRDTALTALFEALRDETVHGLISQAVLGMGGVGKSELALQYAHHYRQQYRLVWWIDADGPDQIRAGLAALARALACGIDSVAAEQATAEEASAWALSWLAAHAGWLVIFDNVEEADHVEPYLARLTHGHVLITTRRDIGWQHLHITRVRLELLSRPDAIALLTDLIGPPDSADIDALQELADQLGYLPLALTQAGTYIASTPRMSLTKYSQLLKDIPDRMYATAVTAGGDAEQVVAQVLTLSHTRIHAINPLAGNLLNLLACFAPDHLPSSVLDGLPDTDPLRIDEALALLASYSLITLTPTPADPLTGSTEDLISMHRLIQSVTLHRLTSAQHHYARGIAVELLLAAFPDDPYTSSTWSTYRALMPHAHSVLPPDSPGLMFLVGYLDASGDYTTAVQLQRQIHSHAMATLSGEHPYTLATRHNLARLLGEVGDTAAARDQLADLLPIAERVLGLEHRNTLTARHNLALWTGKAGDAATARDQLADLLPIEKRVLGNEHPSTLSTVESLAHWTGAAGDAATARDQLADLLPIIERVLGNEHPSTMLTRHNLAMWTGAAGDAATARDQLADLLPTHERIQGNEHPNTLTVRRNLASWTEQAERASANAGDAFT